MSAALALHDDLPGLLRRRPAKLLAFKAHVSKRTIDGVRRGEHVISAPALMELARAYPEVRQFVLRLIDAETGDDPETPAQLIERIRKMVTA